MVRSRAFDLVTQWFRGSGLRGLPTELGNALEEASDEALGYVFERWPVDTGVSRDGWYIDQTGPFSFRLANDVDYTDHVHDGLWRRLVEEAFDEISRDIVFVIESLDLI